MPTNPNTSTPDQRVPPDGVDVNVAVVAGTLSSDPTERSLPSGDLVVNYEVTTRPDDGAADSVPVAWFTPPKSRPTLGAGDEVIVVGRVRRRFFRAGGATASRTEVVASKVSRRTPAATRGAAEAVASVVAVARGGAMKR